MSHQEYLRGNANSGCSNSKRNCIFTKLTQPKNKLFNQILSSSVIFENNEFNYFVEENEANNPNSNSFMVPSSALGIAAP